MFLFTSNIQFYLDNLTRRLTIIIFNINVIKYTPRPKFKGKFDKYDYIFY